MEAGGRAVLRSPRVVLLLLVLDVALALGSGGGALWLGRRELDPALLGCRQTDPDRDHADPPSGRVVAIPPPRTGDRPELAEPDWVGWAWPRAVDFTGAVLRDDAELARTFVAPDYALDLPALRRRLGLVCPPDTRGARWAALDAERAVVESIVFYPDRTLVLDVVFRPYPGGWRVVAVEPATSGRAGRP